MKRISQREAAKLKKRCDELQNEIDLQRRTWSNQWPGGTAIASMEVGTWIAGTIMTARLLKHAVVVTINGDNKTLNFHALQLPRVR